MTFLKLNDQFIVDISLMALKRIQWTVCNLFQVIAIITSNLEKYQ